MLHRVGARLKTRACRRKVDVLKLACCLTRLTTVDLQIQRELSDLMPLPWAIGVVLISWFAQRPQTVRTDPCYWAPANPEKIFTQTTCRMYEIRFSTDSSAVLWGRGKGKTVLVVRDSSVAFLFAQLLHHFPVVARILKSNSFYEVSASTSAAETKTGESRIRPQILGISACPLIPGCQSRWFKANGRQLPWWIFGQERKCEQSRSAAAVIFEKGTFPVVQAARETKKNLFQLCVI